MAQQKEQTKRHTKFDEKSGQIQQNLKTPFDTSAIMPDFFMNEHNNLNIKPQGKKQRFSNISQKRNSSLVGEKDADN